MSEVLRRVRISSQIYCDILIDGVVFVGKTWNFLVPDKLVRISIPFLCSVKDTSKYVKGCKCFGTVRRLYTLSMFELSNYNIHLCFYCNGDPYIEFFTLNSFVVNRLDACVAQMKRSETWKMLQQSTIPRLANRAMSSKLDFTVTITDYKMFGIKFSNLSD